MRLLIVGIILLNLSVSVSAQQTYTDEILSQYDDFLDMSMTAALSEEEGKKATCRMNAVNGDVAAAYYEDHNGAFDKATALDIMTSHFTKGSLTYLLMELAVNKAYEGQSGRAVGEAMYQFCMAQPIEWVNDMEYTKAELDKHLNEQKGWEAADCDNKMEQLDMALVYKEDGVVGEAKLRKIIVKAVESPAMAQRMGDALMRSEDDYYDLVDQFGYSCGS